MKLNKMKLNKYLAVAIAALIVVPTANLLAQDTATQEKVDYKKVVADYIEATGGEMAHKSIESMVGTGKMEIPQAGIEGDISVKQSGNKAYMKIEMAGLGETLVGYDGETAWQISEMTGPEIMEGQQRDQMIRELAASPYLNIEDNYESIECTGTEEFNGEDCYVVVMKAGEEEPEYHYFSVASHLLVGKKMTQEGPMGKMEMVSKLEDYREVAGTDVKMSHKTVVELPQGMTMVTTMTSIEPNVAVEDSIFELPEEIKALKDDK